MGEARASRSRAAFVVLINLVSLGFLVWTLRDAQLGDLRSDFGASDWWWITLAIAAELVVYLWQALRWNLVLKPVVVVRFWQTVCAIFAGLFASEVLPFRAGEVLRGYLVSRWTGLPFSVSAASVLIERVFDGIWLCIGLALTFEFLPFPRQLDYVNAGLGVFVLAGTGLLAFALFQPKRPLGPLPAPGWRRRLAVLRQDLALIVHSRYLLFALFQSVPYLLLQAVPVWALFKGYGFDLGPGPAFALMVILRLASTVPQAPASLGLFQYVTKEVLDRAFGIASPEAARFSLVLWGVIKLPALAAGFAAMAITGVKMDEAKKSAEEPATLRGE
ncbi:MAG: lysylphosphatidylglycerol synthase transmembrane domain-containing protein [Bryobacteraceae bacterium]